MKLVPLLLASSLIANAALCIVVATRSGRATDSSTTKVIASAIPNARPAASPDHPDPETWAGLTAGEQAATAARLRDEGFPLSIQRAILAALITERFSDRHKAL